MRFIRPTWVAVVLAGLALLASGTYLFVLRDGLAADAAPGRLETAVARRLVMLSIPAAARRRPSPVANDLTAWRQGATHFDQHCTVCHGSDGRGSKLASQMYPPVPDLTSPAVQRLSDGALFAIIQHGVRWTGMPAFRLDHRDDEIWQLVACIRHLAQTPSGGASAAGASRSGEAHGNTVIAIEGTSFAPADITLQVGDAVTWVNRDPFPHNVTSTSAGVRSGDLEPDQYFQFRPTAVGRFPYVCTLHPGMRGTLIVTPHEAKERTR